MRIQLIACKVFIITGKGGGRHELFCINREEDRAEEKYSTGPRAVIVAAALFLWLGLAQASYAISGTEPDRNIKWNYNETTKTLTVGLISNSVDDSKKELYYGFITLPWHTYRDEIETVEVSDGVLEIGSDTFREYPKLETVKLPASLKLITGYAFSWSKRLSSVSHPTGDCEIRNSEDDDYYEMDPLIGCDDTILTFYIPGDPYGTSVMADCCKLRGFRIDGQPGSLLGAYIPEKYVGDDPLDEEPDRGLFFFTKKKWTGKAQKPVPTVYLYGEKLLYGSDFTCTYSKNTNVGTATVYIEGIGDYCDSMLTRFIIYPKGTSIKKLTAGKKKLTVKWLKQSKEMSKSHITGYQVQVATNKSFTKNKRQKTIKGYKKTYKTITGLKSKKVYYVRVRTFKDVGEPVDIYSTWSPVKKIKVK